MTQATPTYSPANPLTPVYNYHSTPQHNIERYFGKNLVPINANIPIARQIEGTSIDFTLNLKPVFDKTDNGFVEYKPSRFLVNAATKEKFGIVGKNWKPHQPVDVLSTFQDWCNEQPELQLTHVGQLDGGKIVYALADYPRVIEFGEDVTIAKVLLSNFNKLGFSTRVDLFTYRIVCRNGMTVRSKENSIRLNHTDKSDVGDRLTNSLNQLHKSFAGYQKTMQQLTEVSMSKQEAQALLIKNFGDPDKSMEDQPQMVWAIAQLFEGKAQGSEYLSAYQTAYGLLQSTTEYLNHHSRQTKTHLSSVLYGNKNNSAQKMMQSLSTTYLR